MEVTSKMLQIVPQGNTGQREYATNARLIEPIGKPVMSLFSLSPSPRRDSH